MALAEKIGSSSGVEIRRARDRFHTRTSWLDSWHSFSFGGHYDPDNRGHGQLLVSNDDVVQPGTGFGWHPHRDMEIVTWVLEGELAHEDSTGNAGVITPGLAQRMTAGTGIYHTEMNPSDTAPVHFVQMWVRPDRAGLEPEYEQSDISDRLAREGLVAVASGRGHAGALRIHQRDAVLWVARLGRSDRIAVPEAPRVHLFAASGSAELEGGSTLTAGDAVRLIDAPALSVEASIDGTELLLWETG